MKRVFILLLVCCSCSTTQQLSRPQKAELLKNRWQTQNLAYTKQFKIWSYPVVLSIGFDIQRKQN